MLLLAPLLALGPTLQTQVHVVDAAAGPGADFQFLQSAVDAAGDGDILLMRTGAYFKFDLAGKSLTMIADSGADVAVLGSNPGLGYFGLSTVSNLSPGQSFVSRGVEFQEIDFASSVGAVWIEGAVLDTAGVGFDGAGVRLDDVSAALFIDCSGQGSDGYIDLVGAVQVATAPPIIATDSGLVIEGGSMRGGTGQTTLIDLQLEAGAGSAGLYVDGGLIRTAGAVIEGGVGGEGYGFPQGSAGCPPAGDGGPGLWLVDSQAVLANTSVTGGVGGTGNPVVLCPDGTPPATGQAGLPIFAVDSPALELTTALATLSSTSPVREGQVVQLSIDAPGATGLAIVGTQPAIPTSGPIGAALYVGGTTLVLPLSSSASGPVLTAIVGELGAGVEGVTLYAQAVALLPDLTVERTNPTAIVLLDSGL